MMRFRAISRLCALATAAAALAGCAHAPLPAGPPPPTLFTDVAPSAGLRYRWVEPGPRPLTILGTIGNGCAFLDYNNDGNLDVLLVGPNLALYKGDGKGHFTDVTHAMGLDRLHGHFLGCAVGDYDNDGYDDVYVSGYRTGLLLRNEHGRGFQDVTARAGLRPQPWGTSAAWAETSPGSGRLDLFVGNYVRFGPAEPQLCGAPGQQSGCPPRVYRALKGVFFHNLGGGKFRDVSTSIGIPQTNGKVLGVAFAPLEPARPPVLALANDGVAGDLLQPASAGGRYTDVGTVSGTAFDRDGNRHAGMGVDWGDYDNDGKFDLFVCTFQGESKSLYHNDGRGMFSDQSYRAGVALPSLTRLAFGCKWLDYDNDGWLDLMIANGHVLDNVHDLDFSVSYRQPLQLFHSGGHAPVTFSDATGEAGPDFARPLVGRGLATGDFDNDGRVDVLVVDSEGAPLLLRNESRAANHWLTLSLVGTRSNRDGYGAQVTATAGGLMQTRLCHADGSYLSSSDKRVHLGLGAAATVERLTVRWPSGAVQTLANVAADRVLTVQEPVER